MTGESALRSLLLTSAGLIIWAGHFAAVYAANALACARGFAGRQVAGLDAPVFVALVATAVALAALGATALAAARIDPQSAPPGGSPRAAAFLRWLTLWTAALAALGVAWDAAPALIVPPCL